MLAGKEEDRGAKLNLIFSVMITAAKIKLDDGKSRMRVGSNCDVLKYLHSNSSASAFVGFVVDFFLDQFLHI